MIVRPFNCILPPSIGRRQVAISAKEARYIPLSADNPHSGGWLLTEARPTTLENWERPDILERLDRGPRLWMLPQESRQGEQRSIFGVV